MSGQSSLAVQNGDVNGDGTLDLSDTIYLLNWQFHGGPQPVELFCSAETTSTTADVFLFTGEKVGGSSWLRRDEGSLTMRFDAEGLTPGHTMTVWWVIFNNPDACGGGEGDCGGPDLSDPNVETDLLFADGMVVDEDGKASFAGYLEIGETPGTMNPKLGFEAIGLTDARGAEIHLVIRSHGPTVEGQVAAQIDSFGGGCVENQSPPAIPMDAGECANILYSIHEPEN